MKSSLCFNEKQSLFRVDLKNLITKGSKEKMPVVLLQLSHLNCFSSGWKTLCHVFFFPEKKLFNPVQVVLTKIQWSRAKVYQVTDFLSTEGVPLVHMILLV